jgi:hypothetical protein
MFFLHLQCTLKVKGALSPIVETYLPNYMASQQLIQEVVVLIIPGIGHCKGTGFKGQYTYNNIRLN